MDFNFDPKDVYKFLENAPQEISKKVQAMIREEAIKTKNRLIMITPYSNNNSSVSHLIDSWVVKKINGGYSVLNKKKLKDKSDLASLLNNYSKTKHYEWFNNFWNIFEQELEKTVLEKTIKIIKEALNNG